jgi:hypothetical protein
MSDDKKPIFSLFTKVLLTLFALHVFEMYQNPETRDQVGPFLRRKLRNVLIILAVPVVLLILLILFGAIVGSLQH